jgi:hypothetical protein
VLPSDVSGCTDRAVHQFFANRPVDATCPRSAARVLHALGPGTAEPIAPRRLPQVGTPRGLPPRMGQTVRAAGLSFLDVLAQGVDLVFNSDARVVRLGGLRAGRAVIRQRPREGITLNGYSYVPGVAVSMGRTSLGARAVSMRVRGRAAAHGSLRFDFRHDTISGRLDGRRIGLRLSRQLRGAVARLYAADVAHAAQRAHISARARVGAALPPL